MKCIEAQQLVKPYIEGQLSDRQLEQFLDHVEHCSECYEELEIYFSIYETLGVPGEDRETEEYDFKGKLAQDLKNARRYLHLRKAYRFFRFAVVILAELLLVCTIITGIEMKGEEGSKGTTVYRVIYGRHQNAEAERKTERETEAAESVTEEISECITESRKIVSETENGKESKTSGTMPQKTETGADGS